MQGWLGKLSTSLRGDWKRRWFVLGNGSLYYIRSEKNADIGKPVVVCNLAMSMVRPAAPDVCDLSFTFEIVQPNKRTYLLQALSDRERDRWIKQIQFCIESALVTGPNAQHAPRSSTPIITDHALLAGKSMSSNTSLHRPNPLSRSACSCDCITG